MKTEYGLQLDAYTFPLYLTLVAVWVWSLWLIPRWRQLRWRAMPMSFLGFIWAGFGIHFVVRFPLLCWDSYVFGNMTSRLSDASSGQVNLALISSATYFGFLVAAYGLGRLVIARMMSLRLDIPAEKSYEGQVWLSSLSTVAIIATSGYVPTPVSLFTPLGILGTFWVIPAAFAWFDRFRFGNQVKSMNRWFFLLPGLLHAVLSPYRENLLTPPLIVVVAAGFAGRRIRLFFLTVTAGVLLSIATVLIGSYRIYLWEDAGAAKAIESVTTGYRLNKEYDTKWVEVMRRFHALDSLLLTVRYVPESIPYSHREVIFSTVFRGIVPRAIYQNKEGSTRGLEFGQSIWTFEDSEARGSGAFITPSMPGDLFEIYGIGMVALGGALWGLFAGVLEGLKELLSPKAASAFVALFAFHFFASVERDYAHVVSTTIQYLVMLFIATKVFTIFGEQSGVAMPHATRRRHS